MQWAREGIIFAISDEERVWFRGGVEPRALQTLGFRTSGGGAHQAKTMMASELSSILTAEPLELSDLRCLVLEANALGKSTAAARSGALRHLRSLYGLGKHFVVTDALRLVWRIEAEGRPILALLCALARDPLLRDSSGAVLEVPIGQRAGASEIAQLLARRHPDRFSPAMLKSLSQNCASTWTQSGHLTGKVKKLRTRARPTPVAAAYAALLASLAGFGGPALIASPWLDVLDVSASERLSLLRRAEGHGLVRVRAAGDVVEVVVEPLLEKVNLEFALA